MKINLPVSNPKSEFVQFTGGLDTVTPPLLIPVGKLRRSQNFEEDINQGYVSVTGYERFDGRPSPSQQRYQILDVSVFGTVAVGDTITGATSAATAVVLAIRADCFIVTKVTGTWVSETTTAGGATITQPSVAVVSSAQERAQYLNLAADNYRSDILEVPGVGSILGVAQYGGNVYAFRNTETTDVAMYQSSVDGWTLVPFGFEVYFSSASGTEPAIGASIVQSSVSATLVRCVVESGTFAAGTAAGRLIFSEITAGPFVAGAFTSGITATCVSQETIAIANQDGRFQFITANFEGQFASAKLYGCDGANRGFEFDGTTFIPINTGMGANDQPKFVTAFQKHLFFSFGSSIIHSSIGSPLNWSASVGGAGEIATGDTVTGFLLAPGTSTSPSLIIYSRNSTNVLYGTSSADWQLVSFNAESGAIPYSTQKMWQALSLDDRGLTALSAAQEFGNFSESSLSRTVQNYLTQRRNLVTDSHVSRDKQQYRLFFSDGTAAYWVLGSKINSMMPMLFPNPVLCSSSEETYGGGSELIYFGSDTGFVYQMERGTSFDGEDVQCYMDLVFNHNKSIRALKKYKRVTLELFGTNYNEFRIAATHDYGSVNSAQPDFVAVQSVNLASYNWDSMVWDNFTWDGESLRSITIDTPGHGENMGLSIISSGDYFSPIKFSGAFIEFTLLRMLR